MDTVSVLKTIYNQILQIQGQWITYTINPLNSLSGQIAQAKVDAYTDVLTIIYNEIVALGGT